MGDVLNCIANLLDNILTINRPYGAIGEGMKTLIDDITQTKYRYTGNVFYAVDHWPVAYNFRYIDHKWLYKSLRETFKEVHIIFDSITVWWLMNKLIAIGLVAPITV